MAATTGVLAAALATGLALVLQPGGDIGAISIFVLAVVVAAALGGLVAGLVAAGSGFVALNYFFTEPRHTLRVTNGEDVVSLLTFLVVALIVGAVVARALDERDRATVRERESSLLGYIASKALSGDPLEVVLGDIASSLVEALDLSACEILVRVDGPDLTVRRERRGATLGERRELDLEVEGARVGSLVAILPADEHELDANARRLFEAAGRQISVVLERARLDARIEDARTLVQTNQVRAALFSSVTHDLRTILEETDRLNRLVGNILDLARVRAGALVPDKVPTALEEVVDSVLHRMGPRLAHVRVRTILRDAPDVPADPVQVDQVLTNLIENAVRHSPDGGEVTISVAPWRGGVQVRVTDQGPGVAPEDRERVFDAFVSGQGGSIAAAGERAGSGLGLAIARAIVLAHGGRIWIEGSPSGGASVVFELPVGDAAPVEQEVVREGRP
jgi:two-component system, OmpR family, sensor histidine kinase KdpD